MWCSFYLYHVFLLSWASRCLYRSHYCIIILGGVGGGVELVGFVEMVLVLLGVFLREVISAYVCGMAHNWV